MLFLYKAGDSGAYLTPQDSGKYCISAGHGFNDRLYNDVYENYKEYFTQKKDDLPVVLNGVNGAVCNRKA